MEDLNCHKLPVGKQNETTSLGNSLAVSFKKLNIQLAYELTIPLQGIYPRKNEIARLHQCLYISVHSCFLHDSPKLETTQKHPNWWAAEQTVVQLLEKYHAVALRDEFPTSAQKKWKRMAFRAPGT